jgi:hypothetical protein
MGYWTRITVPPDSPRTKLVLGIGATCLGGWIVLYYAGVPDLLTGFALGLFAAKLWHDAEDDDGG